MTTLLTAIAAAPAAWTYTFDFTTGQHGWVIDTSYGGLGAYTPGIGFIGNWLSVLIQFPTAFTVTGLSLVDNSTLGNNVVGMNYVTHMGPPSSYLPHIWSVPAPLVGVAYNVATTDCVTVGYNGEVVTLSSITISGIGTEPSWS